MPSFCVVGSSPTAVSNLTSTLVEHAMFQVSRRRGSRLAKGRLRGLRYEKSLRV